MPPTEIQLDSRAIVELSQPKTNDADVEMGPQVFHIKAWTKVYTENRPSMYLQQINKQKK